MKKNSSTRDFRSTGPGRLAALGLAAVTAIALVGCGLVKTGYRNGDTVGLFLMSRYLDLTSEQKEYVKPKLRSLLAWHKSTQLPDYAALATDLQKKAQQQITAADVAALAEQARRRVYTTVDHATPDMADIAMRLTPANVRALQKKFDEDDDKYRDENLEGDLEKRQKARYEKTLERVEEWYGKFGREQRTTIRQLSDARPLDNEILLAERQRREGEVIAMLDRIERDRPSREAVSAMLKAIADRFEQSPDPARRAFVESLRNATNEMNARIHNLATPQQRAKAAARLQEWIDDFRTLSAETS